MSSGRARPDDAVLRTDRLVLRRYRSADVTVMHDIYRRSEVARFLLEGPWTEQDAARSVAQRRERVGLDAPGHALALAIEHDEHQIGDVSLWFTDPERRVAEIGWVLHPDASGHGFAAEAVRAALDLAFTQHDAHRVVAQMDARNTASARLAARVGMTHEAHLRQDWWSKGEWTDTLVFAMLATDPIPVGRADLPAPGGMGSGGQSGDEQNSMPSP